MFLCATRSARAQFRKATRIACQGSRGSRDKLSATTDVNLHPMGEAKMNIRKLMLILFFLTQTAFCCRLQLQDLGLYLAFDYW
jgi:hypothetical protein